MASGYQEANFNPVIYVYTVPECVPKERNKKHGFKPFKTRFLMGENTHNLLFVQIFVSRLTLQV